MKMKLLVCVACCVLGKFEVSPGADGVTLPNEKPIYRKEKPVYVTQPLWDELSKTRIARYEVKELPLAEALSNLFEQMPKGENYIKGYRVESPESAFPVSISMVDAELGVVLSYIANVSRMSFREKEGIIIFCTNWMGQELFAIPCKKPTAAMLGIPVDPDSGMLDVLQPIKRLKIKMSGRALYNTKTSVIYLQTSAEEAALLKSLIELLERGARISFE